MAVRGMVDPAVIKQLRHLCASSIANAKAYDVPALCRRVGLADGTEQDAFNSKYKYAHTRLKEIAADDVIKVARALMSEEPVFEILEELAKIDEARSPPVTKLTRKRIVALFERRALASEGEDIDLLRSVWPIAQMPAPFQGVGYTLEDDIVRHTIRNDDLSRAQLFDAVGFLTCSRRQIFKFLEAVTAPEMQTPAEQINLADAINKLLIEDGYTLAVAGKISGSPFFAVRPTPPRWPADEAITATLAAFNSEAVQSRWTAAMGRRASEPAGAITLARTLLEDVCKWILNQAGETWLEADDLPILYRKLAKVLKLAPDDHTEAIFRQILGSCQSVVESLGALRNKLGDAHSIGPIRARPLPRHAELAVNLAGAMAMFLVSTWEARQREANKDEPTKV